jgi:dynein heavy chain
VFGLHPDAEITYLTEATKDMWSQLISLQPRTGTGGSGTSREEFVATIALDIQSRLPPLFDVPRLYKTYGTPSPTQIVLLQELDRWNQLVTVMQTSLKDLLKALKGEIGMSQALDELFQFLFNGQLPNLWRTMAPQTLKKLGSWMQHFERRYQQYLNWSKSGEPTVLWLSGLHIPESYLTALVQTACRRNGWPLDKSSLYTVVTHEDDAGRVTERPPTGCYVTGFYLEGASWDLPAGCLRVASPGGRLIEPLPVMQIIPVESTRLKLHNTYRAPVYVTQQRRNAMGVGLVFEADLATEQHNSHWVLQGVCLCLNDSD